MMKIAIIDHLPVGTGIVRFAYNLTNALLEADNELEIHYYTHQSNFYNNKELFANPHQRLQVRILESTKPQGKLSFQWKKMLQKMGVNTADKLKAELEHLQGYQLFYFTCPHMSPYYKMQAPQFGTFHDFNWKYLFGAPSFSKQTVKILNAALPQWLSHTVAIVSSEFIKTELEKFYPAHAFPVHVAYLPHISGKVKSKVPGILDFPYLLYPANLYSHKNHANLFRAMYLLKKQPAFSHVKLVLTGSGTDHFRYAKFSETGIEEADTKDFDVLGMGYVNNNDMDALVQHALLNISTSLYEAGSGPALDAWMQHAPVIISDIPAHRDQLNHWKIDCLLFDPFDANAIANTIQAACANRSEQVAKSERAHALLTAGDWKATAQQYLNVFKKHLHEL